MSEYGTLLIAIPIVVVLTYYDPTAKKEFLSYDDVQNFFDDERVANFDISGVFERISMGVFEPVSLVLKMIQVDVFDLSEKSDVTCVFIFGLAIHIFNAILASILASELCSVSSEKDKKESQYCSVLAVLILAVHPVFTEVVVWVSAQPYLLATFFSLCALLCQIRGLSQFLGNTFIILAIMSKLAAISVIPFSMLLETYLRYSKKRFRHESILNFCIAHILCVSIALFFIFKTKQYNGVADVLLTRVVCDNESQIRCMYEDETLRPPGCDIQWKDYQVSFCHLWPVLNTTERTFRAFHAVGIYVLQLILLVVPISSQSFTSEMTYGVESLPCIRHPIPHRDDESLSFLTPCTIFGFALFLYAGFDLILSRGSRIKMVSFLILLLPTLGLMGNHKGELASDRYIYLASFCVGVWILTDLFRALAKTRFARTILCALVVCCVTVSSSRSRIYASVWNSSRDLWQHTATVCAPNDARSMNAYARESIMSLDAYNRFHWRWHNEWKGSDLLLALNASNIEDRIELSKAVDLFSHAVKLHPMMVVPRNGLAMTLVALGRSKEALEHFERSHVLKPKNTLIANRLGNVLAAMERFEDAANVWIRTSSFDPSVPEHMINAGIALARAGKYKDSIRMLESALRITTISDESRDAANDALSQVVSFAG